MEKIQKTCLETLFSAYNIHGGIKQRYYTMAEPIYHLLIPGYEPTPQEMEEARLRIPPSPPRNETFTGAEDMSSPPEPPKIHEPSLDELRERALQNLK